LRLENLELSARIKQMQLSWWQRPIPFLTALASAVPILFTIVVQVSSSWSAAQRKAADVEKQAAAVAIREAESEKKDAETTKRGYELINSKLKFEQLKLEGVRADLESRVEKLQTAEKKLIDDAFGRFKRICEIGGSIVTADSSEEANQEFKKLDSFDLLVVGLSKPEIIRDIKSQLEMWESSPQQPEGLAAAVLALSLACKESFKQYQNEQFRQPVRALTLAIFGKAEQMIRTLESSKDVQTPETSRVIKEFWNLYYGELVLVENPNIASAMVSAGTALRLWKVGPPNQKILEKLAAAFRTEFDSLTKEQKSAF
jgi:hypothetical protein